jgi:hypothetical protein
MKPPHFFAFLIVAASLGLASADEKIAVPEVARNIPAEKTSDRKDRLAKYKIDIYPLYSMGLPRATPYISGEAFSFSVRVTPVESSKAANLDIAGLAELYDPDGNLVTELPEMSYGRNSLQFGGSAFTQTFCFAPDDPRPGKYRLKFLIVDHAGGKSESADYAFEIAGKETYGAMGIAFSSTPDHYTPCGNNFTLGEPKFLMYCINGAGVQEDRIHLKSTLTILDAKKQPTDAEPRTIDTYKPAPRSNNDHPIVYFLVFPNSRPGDFVLHLELMDCIADKTASYDLPIKVLPPPGMDE